MIQYLEVGIPNGFEVFSWWVGKWLATELVIVFQQFSELRSGLP